MSDENETQEPALSEEPKPLAPLGVERADAVALVEALLFASGKPVSLEKLAEAGEISKDEVERALARLEVDYNTSRRGMFLERVAGGVRLVSRAEFDFPIRRLMGLDGKNKLSMAGLETLAIIAYRQPVTAPEIAEIRGVNSSSSLRTLLERKLITTAGRKEVVGTPFLYKTTKEFLIHFGLKSPGDLPKPEELDLLYGVEPAQAPEPEQTELFPEEPQVLAEEAGETGAEAPPKEESVVMGESSEGTGVSASPKAGSDAS